ncbi:hypothetical protein O181_020188 [Austropuccinia psidii MF-1]|uniref:Uncharacterized protein n=1 Tax=Austropuccinia psidii MF-1 TaxID=1389203 RepID=A0A9Q3GUA1_9BASI|nr:hypothetical protein [Austropuccinia psidii MF-1]
MQKKGGAEHSCYLLYRSPISSAEGRAVFAIHQHFDFLLNWLTLSFDRDFWTAFLQGLSNKDPTGQKNMLCLSTILLAAFSLAPTLVVPTASIDDIKPPSDPSKKVKVYRTSKAFLAKMENNSWDWELDGDSHLKIQTGYNTGASFEAYVNDGTKNRTLTVQIHSGKIHCRSSQTYSAKITNRSNKTTEQFDFKLHTRGPLSDHWHLLKGTSLNETYIWFRKTYSLSGSVIRKDIDKKVAHIHCISISFCINFSQPFQKAMLVEISLIIRSFVLSGGYGQLDCKISTNDELPIDYLIALLTCADVRHTRFVRACLTPHPYPG